MSGAGKGFLGVAPRHLAHAVDFVSAQAHRLSRRRFIPAQFARNSRKGRNAPIARLMRDPRPNPGDIAIAHWRGEPRGLDLKTTTRFGN